MDELEPTLLIIPLLAVLAPLLARALGRWVRMPIVVFELLLGILVGPTPARLGACPRDFVDALSQFGLAMLFFVAGSEIEFAAFRGRTGRDAIFGWLISLAVGVGVGWLIAPGEEAIIIGIALCSTALGTILPILRDAGELRTPFGQAIGRDRRGRRVRSADRDLDLPRRRATPASRRSCSCCSRRSPASRSGSRSSCRGARCTVS